MSRTRPGAPGFFFLAWAASACIYEDYPPDDPPPPDRGVILESEPNDAAPRAGGLRFGEPVHIFNNYYYDIGDYGVATTMNAGVIFEGNYIENTESPTEIGQGDSAGGRIVSRNNHLVNSGTPVSSGSVAGVPYSFTLDTPSNVKSIVTGGAGAR